MFSLGALCSFLLLPTSIENPQPLHFGICKGIDLFGNVLHFSDLKPKHLMESQRPNLRVKNLMPSIHSFSIFTYSWTVHRSIAGPCMNPVFNSHPKDNLESPTNILSRIVATIYKFQVHLQEVNVCSAPLQFSLWCFPRQVCHIYKRSLGSHS